MKEEVLMEYTESAIELFLKDYLKKRINDLRDMRKYTIKSDTMTEEQLYYLQEGYREGLCASAMMLADELDSVTDGTEMYSEKEEQWWHYHDDKDTGTEERL